MTGRRLAKGRHARRPPVHALPGPSCLVRQLCFVVICGSYLRCAARGTAGVICDGTKVESRISCRARAMGTLGPRSCTGSRDCRGYLRRNEGGVANLLQGPSELDTGSERYLKRLGERIDSLGGITDLKDIPRTRIKRALRYRYKNHRYRQHSRKNHSRLRAEYFAK